MSSRNSPYLPFFVYGTLRPGERNYFMLRGRTIHEQPASVPGFLLYSLGSYPMAILPDASLLSINPVRLHGVLMTVAPAYYASTLRALDALEDCISDQPENSLYWRIQHPISLENSIVTAWIYVGNQAFLSKDCSLITSGDWVAYRQQGE